MADGERFEEHRNAPLEDLGVGGQRVGHVGVDGVGALVVGSGAGAAADGFVVLVGALVAEGEVVHGALAGRHDAERPDQRVGDGLRGFHVAGDHGGGILGRQEAVFRNDHVEGLEAAPVEGDIVVDHEAEDVEHGRHAHRRGRVEVVGLLGRGAGEIDGRLAPPVVHLDGHAHLGAEIRLHDEAAVLEFVQDAAHAFLGVVLDVRHVGVHHVEPEVRHHLAEFLHALLVGGDLRLQIGQVVVEVARRVGRPGEQFLAFLFQEPAPRHQLEVVDEHPFLVDVPAVGRYRARGLAADLGVMAARGDVEQDGARGLVENRGDHGDVGKMRAAVVGRVEHEHVARLDGIGAFLDDGLDAIAHRAQVHRDVRRVGDEIARRVENGATEVEPFLDVDGIGRVLQGDAHLLGDRHEEVVEYLEHHRVGLGADLGLAGARLDADEHQVVEPRHVGRPTRLDHRGRVGVDDDGRPADAGAGLQVLAVVDLGRPPAALHEGLHFGQGLGRCAAALGGELGVLDLRGAADDLHGKLLGDQFLLGRDEAVQQVVGALEGGDHVGAPGEFDLEGRIGAVVAQVHLLDGPRPRRLDALARHLVAAVLFHGVESRFQIADEGVVEDGFHGALAHDPVLGQPHAVGRQDSGEGMDEDPGDAQRVGDQAGVLAAGAAEAVEGVFGDVVAALDRDLFDGVGHIVDGDLEEAVGRFDGGALVPRRRLDLGGEGRELLMHGVGVQGLVGVRSEDLGKEPGLDLADHQVGVGHGERPAAAIARRARIGARRIGTNPVARAVEMQDRATARRHRVDAHHGGAHAHAGDQGLEGALVFAVVVGDVGRRAAHVEGDDPVEARHVRGAHGADDAAGRPREDAVLALEEPGVGEPAVRLHEHEPRTVQLGGDAVHVAAQDGRHVGIDHRGVAAPDKLHQRAHLVRDRDLREPHLAGDLGHRDLVVVVAVAVHEDDGSGTDAVPMCFLEGGAHALEVGWAQLLAFRRVALVDLDDPLIEQLGQHDVAGEELRAVLITDAQRVAEALGDEQHGALALALEKGVGGHRGSHFHRLDGRSRDVGVGGHPQQVAHPLQGGVLVASGVLREQLVGEERAVGLARHDVRKGAAAVDPELPAAGRGRRSAHPRSSMPASRGEPSPSTGLPVTMVKMTIQ